jgi:hypothetical protein
MYSSSLKRIGDQSLVGAGGMGRFPPAGLEREMNEAASGGRWPHRQDDQTRSLALSGAYVRNGPIPELPVLG